MPVQLIDLVATARDRGANPQNSVVCMQPDLINYAPLLKRRHREPEISAEGWYFPELLIEEVWAQDTPMEQLFHALIGLTQQFKEPERGFALTPLDGLDQLRDAAHTLAAFQSNCNLPEKRRAYTNASRNIVPSWEQYTQALRETGSHRQMLQGFIICVVPQPQKQEGWLQLFRRLQAPGWHYILPQTK